MQATSTISMSESGGRMIQLPRFMAPRARSTRSSLSRGCIEGGKNGINAAAGGWHQMRLCVYAVSIVTNEGLPDFHGSWVAIKRRYHLLGWVAREGARDSSRHGRSRRNGEIG